MKELIKSLNLTIRDFSEKYEIPYNTVRQWYNGERKPPNYIKNLLIELSRRKETYEKPKKQPKYVYCFINEEHQIPLRMRIFTDKENVLEAHYEERYSASEDRIKEEYKNNNVYRYILADEKKIK